MVRWGLIGASDIAETRVVPAMRALGLEVVSVFSATPEYSAAYAARNAIDLYTSDLDALLSRDDIDAVYISSTNAAHASQAKAAAAAGKHVLCEKPLATSLEDAYAIVDACERAGVLLAVNHHLPGAGTHRAIRKLVSSGAIGQPLWVSVRHAVLLPERLRTWRLSGEPGAGCILDITVHDASVVNPLLGRRAIEAMALSVRQGPWTSESEDAVAAVIRYEGNVLVQTHDSFTSAFTPTRLEVHGDEGSIEATNVMTQDPAGDVHLRGPTGLREILVDDRRDLYEIAIGAFASAVHLEGDPTVSGSDGVKAYAVAQAVLDSSRSGHAAAVQ
jgi:1,5-anhydro-D-fructose reductase (1,5-anhydro-D-mannitol-forming)